MEQLPANSLAIAFSAVAGAILFWLLLTVLIARLSGWQRLARDFEATYQPSGQRFSFQSAQFNQLANYSGMLTVGVSEEGLGLRVIWPFRAGHPPLFISWDYVATAERVSQFLSKGVVLQVTPRQGGRPVAVFLIGQRVADAVWERLPGHLTRTP